MESSRIDSGGELQCLNVYGLAFNANFVARLRDIANSEPFLKMFAQLDVVFDTNPKWIECLAEPDPQLPTTRDRKHHPLFG